MSHIEGEIVIARPPEAIFDFVADECNEPRFNPKMVRAENTAWANRPRHALPRRGDEPGPPRWRWSSSSRPTSGPGVCPS